MMEQLTKLMELIKFGPEYGDWSGALVAIAFGIISFVITFLSALFFFIKWRQENKHRHLENERIIATEQRENYNRSRERYDTLWDNLSNYGAQPLNMHYSRDKKNLKAYFKDDVEYYNFKGACWQLINFLSDVEFEYCNHQDGAYWKRWRAIFKYVFSHQLLRTAFAHNREDFKETNNSFVEYLEDFVFPKIQENKVNLNKNKKEDISSENNKTA